MKQSFENKYSMYLSTLAVLDAHSTEVAEVGAFADALAAFRIKVNEINSTTQAQGTPITGVSTDKRDARDALIDLVLEIAGAVQAYASASENRTLFEEVDFSKTSLQRQSDAQFPATAQIIHDAAQTNLAALADYNIDAPRLAELQSAINDDKDVVPTTRVAVSERKSQTGLLNTLFADADALVKERLDKLMKWFRNTNTVFFTDYSNARLIVDSGIRHTELKGKVQDSNDGAPIAGAVIKISAAERDTTTDVNGNYSIKEFSGGIYSIHAEANGYQTKDIPNVEIPRGKSIDLKIELVTA